MERARPDKTVLLQQVDISVRKGEMLVVVGKTGAGKSGPLGRASRASKRLEKASVRVNFIFF